MGQPLSRNQMGMRMLPYSSVHTYAQGEMNNINKSVCLQHVHAKTFLAQCSPVFTDQLLEFLHTPLAYICVWPIL